MVNASIELSMNLRFKYTSQLCVHRVHKQCDYLFLT
jgi:hypothetical protein